ncbi:MAG: 4Fe-4S binding protein [Holophagaceae bacterium]|nr:4Fe-4S binding protein [Holophagaceae bacterium]
MSVWARRITQAFFLLLFLILFIKTESDGSDKIAVHAHLFVDMSPLVAISTLLSGHALFKGMVLSLVVVIFTALLGRVFCGWVCPLGVLNNIVGALKKWKGTQKVRGWFYAKYLLLIFLLSGSLVGIQLTGIFDPMSLLTRHLTVGLYPAFNYGANGVLDSLLGTDVKFIVILTEKIYFLLGKTVLAFQQPFFVQGALMSLLLIAILLSNLSERRFWCRYLCPLGALLGFFGRWAPFKRRISTACNSCGICDRKCQGGVKTSAWVSSECYYCMACVKECPKNAVSFSMSAKPAIESVVLGRRNVIVAGCAGLASVAISRATPSYDPNRPNPDLIRPPGALPEKEFLERCVKCGECMKVCTTNALQPTLMEAGFEGIWTPIVIPTRGYCEYNCTLCGQVCPTGAIKELTKEEKRQWRIGTAMFDRSRCLPHAHNEECLVCEEFCPTPKKSIKFRERDRFGEGNIKQPYVDLKTCVGCGICVSKCPIVDAPGIRVTSIGETRSKKNQILLDSDPYGG